MQRWLHTIVEFPSVTKVTWRSNQIFYIWTLNMHGKEYIAIFLVMVFLGKLITLDTDIFSFLLSTDRVVVLNPLCEKKNNDIKETGEHFKSSSPVQLLKLARTCSNNYQLIAEKEIPEIRDLDFREFVYVRPLVISIHPRKLYPPPKYSIMS